MDGEIKSTNPNVHKFSQRVGNFYFRENALMSTSYIFAMTIKAENGSVEVIHFVSGPVSLRFVESLEVLEAAI